MTTIRELAERVDDLIEELATEVSKVRRDHLLHPDDRDEKVNTVRQLGRDLIRNAAGELRAELDRQLEGADATVTVPASREEREARAYWAGVARDTLAGVTEPGVIARVLRRELPALDDTAREEFLATAARLVDGRGFAALPVAAVRNEYQTDAMRERTAHRAAAANLDVYRGWLDQGERSIEARTHAAGDAWNGPVTRNIPTGLGPIGLWAKSTEERIDAAAETAYAATFEHPLDTAHTPRRHVDADTAGDTGTGESDAA